MIALDPSTTLRVSNTSATAAVSVAVSGVSVTPTGDTPFDDVASVVNTAGVDVVAAPSAGNQKTLTNITITATVAAVSFVLSLYKASVAYPLMAATLRLGQRMVYETGKGWTKVDTDGTPLVRYDESQTASSLLQVSVPFNRASISTMIAGADFSLWRGTGFPAQGAVPAAAAVCTNATTGALPLAARSGAQKRRLLGLAVNAANVGQTFHLVDRLAHMGGLSGTVTTAQTVGINLSALGNNVAARKGSADYKEVLWFLDWYTATGATVATPTVAVTYDDDTTGNCNIWNPGTTALPASVAASRRYQIISATGKGIKAVNTVTLSASTATAGSFGVTAERVLATVTTDPLAYRRTPVVFGKDVAPIIEDEACLTLTGTSITTTTGVMTGNVRQDVSDV